MILARTPQSLVEASTPVMRKDKHHRRRLAEVGGYEGVERCVRRHDESLPIDVSGVISGVIVRVGQVLSKPISVSRPFGPNRILSQK